MSNTMIDYYAVLEVERNADDASIRKSYRKLVLKYHPDKNPEDPEKAEAKIRQINAAYETLSNPTKRAAWEASNAAMQRRACGVRISPKASNAPLVIPKRFMLCPMGHPDKFLRSIGNTLAFHTRDDVSDVDFETFFGAARFEIWWVPKSQYADGVVRNNMCRMRRHFLAGQHGGLITGPPNTLMNMLGAAQQQAVKKKSSGLGLNLSWGLSHDVHTSDIMLTPSENPPCCNLIPEPSPHHEGAYRFEAAAFPGHYLAFCPPMQIQMLDTCDSFTILDFVLTDFDVCERFKRFDELLLPFVMEWDGHKKFIHIDKIRGGTNFRHEFRKHYGDPLWDVQDFEIYFQAHSEIWDYIPDKREVRLRDKIERIAYSLKRLQKVEDVLLILGTHDFDVLPFDIISHLLVVLAKPVRNDDSTTLGNQKTAQKIILRMLSAHFRGDAKPPLDKCVSIWGSLEKFGVSQADEDVSQLRANILQEIRQHVSDSIASETCKLDFHFLGTFLDMQLDWDRLGPVIAKTAKELISPQSLETLTPLIQKAARVGAGVFGETLSTSSLMKTFGANPVRAAEALGAMASGGFFLEGVAASLDNIIEEAPLELCARVLIGLGEHGFQGAGFKKCCEVVKDDEDLGTLSYAVFADLAAVAQKSNVVADSKLGDAICTAACTRLQSDRCPPVVLMKLLKLTAGLECSAISDTIRAALLDAAAKDFTKQHTDIASDQLLDAVDVLSKTQSKPHMELLASQVLEQVPNLSPPQRLSFTKSVVVLGDGSSTFQKIMDYWWKTLANTQVGEQSKSGKEADRVSADQVAELAELLAPVAVPDQGIFEILASCILREASELTGAGAALLQKAFPEDGSGPPFPNRTKLMRHAREVREKKKPVQERPRSRSAPKKLIQERPRSRSVPKKPVQERPRSRSLTRRQGQERPRSRSVPRRPIQERPRSPRGRYDRRDRDRRQL